MASNMIKLINPDPAKQGATIQVEKYDTIRAAILQALRAHGRLTYEQIARDVEQQLAGNFEGSIRWYVTAVKLDLEGKHVLERVKEKGREYVQLAQEKQPQ